MTGAAVGAAVDGGLPPEAWASALAGLPAMGPARLRAVLAAWHPEEAWARVAAGSACSVAEMAEACRPDPSGLARLWRGAARRVNVADLWDRYGRTGVAVALPGGPGFPPELQSDPDPPALLFCRGRPSALDGRRVAIVGARRCSRYGREVAYELGRDLAQAGVRVVSGLALGIDGAAHSGALSVGGAPPVAVVGSGLDVVYPAAHGPLWRQVAASGLLLSEAPLGARPEPWRFPARNRIIAALAEVVVVVESTEKGGSRHTVEAAEGRDRQVMAVPGSVRSPVSAYPNSLLADGCAPVRDALDVLVALGLSSAGRLTPAGVEGRPEPGPEATGVLEAMGWEPATFDDLCARTGRGPGQVSVALAGLQSDGWVVDRAGWWERVGGRDPHIR
ncbi:MAG: DNA-protecting protein DprA [Actinomycetota bacterium]|nr:DNA-protecting protein DprA [Actinomycetota bacterium]